MDHDAQLEILANALTRITDFCAGADSYKSATASEVLERVGDIAAEALAAAATFGTLPQAPADR